MPRLRSLCLPAGLLLVAWAGPSPEPTVAIRVFQFEPRTLEVPVGTRVRWINGDDIEHTVTSGDGEKADGRFGGVLAGKGTTFSTTFDQPGVYTYYCDRHHFMRGEVRVTPTGKAGN